MPADDHRYHAVRSSDPRFDGVFYVGVRSTGIYCRPSCPAITPKRRNTAFFPSAAAAQNAGFRACKRCRPDAAPGSPEWNIRADTVGRAMRMIADGTVDRDGVTGLASSLGYSQRQLQRLLTAELGAGPLALARAQRAQTARVLVETTPLSMSDIAFASGFSSIRQFNDTMRAVFALSPTGLRARSSRWRTAGHPNGVTLRLAYREPFDARQVFGFLAARAVPGVEEVDGNGTYRRVLRLPHGTGTVEVLPQAEGGFLQCRVRLEDLRDLGAAVQRCRRMLDADTDPRAVSEVLREDPLLAPVVARSPGLRSPGHPCGSELAVWTVLAQRSSLPEARTAAAWVARRHGTPLTAPGGLTHAFPTADTLAGASAADLPLPERARTLLDLCAALADGSVDLGPGADREENISRLAALPGVGPTTAGYVRMRALGDPDVFLPGDSGVRRGLSRLGVRRPLGSAARAWRPWRSYATHHLWAAQDPAHTDQERIPL
ncbi:DNA-3-methyladenine glycosylase II [Haloactinospora alba]|uniref:DNA-3-methyladenine glycosylase II n=1 Tax=Haloactinospora alba TaxID=405555 RepID=A0A543NMB9_9ACTN|nr:AlkA N-terminal domain-containing protein [Haloactinospora alba]TQN32963.1 DNA-3-methyladenine glycosylase II [Haloactinospora alba]